MPADNPYFVSGGGEAFDLDEIKAFCRVTFTDDDSFINNLSIAAQSKVESYTGRVLIDSVYKWNLDRFIPSRNPASDFFYTDYPLGNRQSQIIPLPIAPIKSVDSINYFDYSGNLETLDPSKYQVDARGQRIGPSTTEYNWPQTESGRLSAVEIEMSVGYGQSFSDVPIKIRQAIGTLVAYWYENREAYTAGFQSFNEAPQSFFDLLAEYKQGWF